MADVAGYSLVIYNRYSGFCRIESDFMKPTHPNFIIGNESSYLNDGIFSMTLTNEDLFYAPLKGDKILETNKYSLRKCPKLSEANRLTHVTGTLSGQTGSIVSQDNVIFFSNIPKRAILCADITKKFDPSNSTVIAQNSEKLFLTGLKFRKDNLILLTNRFQNNFNNLKLNETNFRILTLNINKTEKETNSCFHQL